MNLSSDTVAVLKNFSDINQNILVKPGNKVQTISTMKNILAEAEISEKFDSEFAIYDLPEFLRAVELFQKPNLNFNGGSNVQIADNNSKQSIKYFFESSDIKFFIGIRNKNQEFESHAWVKKDNKYIFGFIKDINDYKEILRL